MKNVSPHTNGASGKIHDLNLAFDVGHSSIGWSVLKADGNAIPEFLGCGAVVFPADDCLAIQRRTFRRQRRHIRSTRQRISRIKTLLRHLEVMPVSELEEVSSSSPWLLAARVLAGGHLLTWSELWDVLRWYAHNRGYDGNKRWSADNHPDEDEDTEKVENARALFTKYGTHSMAETFCRALGLDPLKAKSSSTVRFKGLNAAFPREDVEREVRTILDKHCEHLPKVDDAFIHALLEDSRAIKCEEIRLPLRYQGGLLFGQLVPRFENRIIAKCPITFERIYQAVINDTADAERAKEEAEKLAKVPAKECMEFYRFRWAMQLANVQIVEGSTTRPLTEKERKAIDVEMREKGFFTVGEFKKAVRAATGGLPDNLNQMMLHPDAHEALILDPVKKLSTSDDMSTLFALLPPRLQKRVTGQWRQGKSIRLSTLRDYLSEVGEDTKKFDAELDRLLDGSNTRRKKKAGETTRQQLFEREYKAKPLSGRAPYSREVMRETDAFVFATNRHPTQEGGPLFRSEAIRSIQLQRTIDDQTNNHLVRHRLLILSRLHKDLLKEFAEGNPERVGHITIEVNRDLRDLSGKTAKQVAQDLGQMLANFKGVTKKLEEDFEGKNISITPGLIRKARIAEDLKWTCPYTGKPYDAFDLLNRS
ncbi:MAG: type II CRISPR RNA-guided endonuclease Cas9, partial [Chthoniobacterales bacterium]